jgi:thioredoxin 1
MATTPANPPLDSQDLRGPGLVLVDFWAPWCDVCQATSLIAEELAERYRGAVRTVKVNVDENPVLAARYHVHAVPTLALVEDGQLVEQFAGVASREKVQGAVDEVLARRL